MSLICKFCRSKMDNCVQCITCLDISCEKCGIYCTGCDTYTCKRCPEKDPVTGSLLPSFKMYCVDCNEILCGKCTYLKVVDGNQNLRKYCIKNNCYVGHTKETFYKLNGDCSLNTCVPNLANYIDELKREIIDLKAQIECIPGGKTYQDAKEHFESHQ